MPGFEECANGIDDDGDGRVDCVDPDCSGDAACPEACGSDPRFSVVRCRVAALWVRTAAATAMEPFTTDVTGVLAKATEAAAGAETACVGGERVLTRRALRQLGKGAAKYGKQVRARRGRTAIPEDGLRTALVDDARSIRVLARQLRQRSVACFSVR